MADNVRYILDKLSVVFHEIEILDICNKNEIITIIKKITNYEYTLKRMQLNYQENISYYNYMIQLIKLFDIRSKKMILKIKKNKKMMKHFNDKYSNIILLINNHIIYIFDRSVRRFSTILTIWNDYIQFLQKYELYKNLNIIYGQVLSLYPRNEEFWINASLYELHHNCNLHASRITLQRGLRLNKNSPKLWIKLFEIEIFNILRLQERTNILKADNTEIKMIDDNKAYDDSVEKIDSSEGGDDNDNNNNDLYFTGSPLIVFNHALNNLTEINAIFSMYFTCVSLSVSQLQLIPAMKDAIINKFGDNYEIWEKFCDLYLSDLNSDDINDDVDSRDNDGCGVDVGNRDISSSRKILVTVTTTVTNVITTLNQGKDLIFNNNIKSNNSSTGSIDKVNRDDKLTYISMIMITLKKLVTKIYIILKHIDIKALSLLINHDSTNDENLNISNKKNKKRKLSSNNDGNTSHNISSSSGSSSSTSSSSSIEQIKSFHLAMTNLCNFQKDIHHIITTYHQSSIKIKDSYSCISSSSSSSSRIDDIDNNNNIYIGKLFSLVYNSQEIHYILSIIYHLCPSILMNHSNIDISSVSSRNGSSTSRSSSGSSRSSSNSSMESVIEDISATSLYDIYDNILLGIHHIVKHTSSSSLFLTSSSQSLSNNIVTFELLEAFSQLCYTYFIYIFLMEL
jgi:hypothetical protein